MHANRFLVLIFEIVFALFAATGIVTVCISGREIFRYIFGGQKAGDRKEELKRTAVWMKTRRRVSKMLWIAMVGLLILIFIEALLRKAMQAGVGSH